MRSCVVVYVFFIVAVLICYIFRVKLEGQETSVLRIVGNVVERSLELLSMQNEDNIECVKFGSTYYGTDKTESAYLFNNGPEPVGFVCILEEDAIGQEVVHVLFTMIKS